LVPQGWANSSINSEINGHWSLKDWCKWKENLVGYVEWLNNRLSSIFTPTATKEWARVTLDTKSLIWISLDSWNRKWKGFTVRSLKETGKRDQITFKAEAWAARPCHLSW
jgi:hypothetical protein